MSEPGAGSGGGRGRWLRTLARGPQDWGRLIVFPHAGGAVGFYRPLRRVIDGASVLAVQYPGRQDRIREAQLTSVEQIATSVISELERVPRMTTVLMGHSMGALAAFEVARRRPDLADGLIVSAHRAPSVPSRSTLHLADDAALLEETRAMGGTDEEVLAHPDLVQLIIAHLRADLAVDAAYLCPPGERLSVSVTVMRGSQDTSVTAEDARAWDLHTESPSEQLCLTGGHFYLLDRRAEVVGVLGEEMTRARARAEERTS